MADTIRTAFFISDGTGITAETLGHSLLTQFEGVRFNQTVVPFVDSPEKAREALARIDSAARATGTRPIVFTTLVNNEVRETLKQANWLVLDFFETFLGPLEDELKQKSTHTVGRSHQQVDNKEYEDRIDAINFSLAHDDGQSARELARADVILVGVSRSGKTPTSLYLALQFGVKAANCPLIPEDFDRKTLPKNLEPHRAKLYGLSIAPERLAAIRHERRPGSKYAELANCRWEVEQAESMMKRNGIPWLNSTTRSIEEIATKILQEVKIERRVY
jgi:[pyruvate, water dikinase]-phosphate phosphotransferase / [pyruvate, water dikinase] kinase